MSWNGFGGEFVKRAAVLTARQIAELWEGV